MQADQRRHPRRPLQVLLRGRDAEGVGNLVFEASDLSAGGVFLASDFLLDPGDGLTLEFQVPGDARVLKVQARVVWVRRFPTGGERAGMGVEFVRVADPDRDALTRFLRESEPG